VIVMTTPSYKGQNQPAAASGSWLTSLFGGGTPAYVSALASKAPTASTQTGSAQTATAQTATTQSAPTSQPFFAFAAPAYRLASVSTDSECDDSASPSIAIVIPSQAMDPQQ
jgi:hypothetical protein